MISIISVRLRCLYLLLFLVVFSGPGYGQLGDAELRNTLTEIHARIPALMNTADVPGLTLAVVANDELIFSSGWPTLRARSRWLCHRPTE